MDSILMAGEDLDRRTSDRCHTISRDKLPMKTAIEGNYGYRCSSDMVMLFQGFVWRATVEHRSSSTNLVETTMQYLHVIFMLIELCGRASEVNSCHGGEVKNWWQNISSPSTTQEQQGRPAHYSWPDLP